MRLSDKLFWHCRVRRCLQAGALPPVGEHDTTPCASFMMVKPQSSSSGLTTGGPGRHVSWQTHLPARASSDTCHTGQPSLLARWDRLQRIAAVWSGSRCRVASGLPEAAFQMRRFHVLEGRGQHRLGSSCVSRTASIRTGSPCVLGTMWTMWQSLTQRHMLTIFCKAQLILFFL